MLSDYFIINLADKAARAARTAAYELKRAKGDMLDAELLAVKTEDIYLRNLTVSPLLRLSPELRNNIFGYVCGGMTILFRSDRIDIKDGLWGNSPSTHQPFVALQQTCRQIYSDTALIPFSKINKFWYYDGAGIRTMQHGLLSAQQKAISTVHFSIKEKTCPARGLQAWGSFKIERLGYLDSFPGLEKVILYYIQPFSSATIRKDIEKRIRDHAPSGVVAVHQEVLRVDEDVPVLARPPTCVILTHERSKISDLGF